LVCLKRRRFCMRCSIPFFLRGRLRNACPMIDTPYAPRGDE
jgi:hypothetical protein